MAFAIMADFPLGTYRAHGPDGALDPLPSPARLHAALLNAAAQGTRAERQGDRLVPTAADRAALTWTESHPPDALHLPALVLNETARQAYRNQGIFHKTAIKIWPKEADGCTALSGRLGWIWTAEPPPAVRDSLTALCADVSHLGTAESPVVLEAGELSPTHLLDPSASLFVGSGIDVEVAQPGRTEALEAAYRASLEPVPSRSSDAVRTDEVPAPPPVERAFVTTVRYRPIERPAPQAPWSMALLLGVDDYVPPALRVAWCVALHRALISLIGDGAPALVTGRYPAGAVQPANRLAIQYVERGLPLASALDGAGAFLLLVPSDADAADLASLARALRSLRQVRITRHQVATIAGEVVTVPADEFWQPVHAGAQRLWLTDPAAVPDSRPVRGHPWTLGDAALLSIGLVWRDQLGGPGHGSAWYRALADAAAGRGAAVVAASKLHAPDQDRYVHRVPEGSVIQAYRALVRLGSLAGGRTVSAIGQSRHLGGGLLVPRDIPIDADELEEGALLWT